MLHKKLFGTARFSENQHEKILPDGETQNQNSTTPPSERLLSAYGNNLAKAISAVGLAAAIDLVIDEAVNVAADTIIPANIRVKPRNSGIFNVANGVTLIIGAMSPVGSQKVFSGSGNKVFTKGAVPHFNLAWWMGGEEAADATSALNNIITSLANGYGGTALIPTGTWRTSGGHNLPSYSIFQGLGRTAKLLLTANNSHILKIGGNLRDVSVRDLVLDCGTTSGSKGILATGSYPNSTISVECHNVTTLKGDVGFDVLSTTPDDARRKDPWEMIQVRFVGCNWVGCKTSFRCNTNNNGVSFESPYFNLPAGGTALHLELVGSLSIKDHLCVGNVVGTPIDGSTFIYSEKERGAISIQNGQDEGIQYFYRSAGNAFPQNTINLDANLIQSILQFNASATVYSRGNIYLSKLYRDAANVNTVVHSEGDRILPRDAAGRAVEPPVLSQFTGLSYIASEQNTVQSTSARHQFNEDSLAPVLNGQTKAQTPPFPNQSRPVRRISSTSAGQVLLQLGTASGNDFYGFSFYRDGTNGNLILEGNQPGYNNYEFKGDVIIPDSNRGIILTAPNGRRYRVTVGNTGVLTATPVA